MSKYQDAVSAILDAIGEPDEPLSARVRYALEPPPQMDAADYAEAHVVLPHGTNARSGPYTFRAAPYSEEWLRVMSDTRVRQVTLITSTQVGKSTALLLRVCWGVGCDPSPMLWVGPRGIDVKYMVSRRLKPILSGSPELARHLTGTRSDDRLDEIAFGNGAILYTGTGRSAASLRSKPIKVAIGDEVSDWPQIPKKQEGAHGVQLMRERLRTWGTEAQLVIATTPTVETEAAWQEFLESDRRRFWLPCPRCGAWQTLEEDQLRWPQDATHATLQDDQVLYLCSTCGDPILDSEKLGAMQRGRWVPDGVPIDVTTGEVDAYEPSPHRGYQLSALYSPWLTWGAYARELLKANQDPERLQGFVNLWRGLPYRPVVQRMPGAQLAGRVLRSLPRGRVHRAAQVVTVGCDVQKDYLVWVVRAWGYDWQSWGVDHGICRTWSEFIRDVVERAWPRQDGNGSLAATKAGVDMADGNRSDEVYALAREYPGLVTPMRGDHRKVVPVQLRTLATSRVTGADGMQYALWSNPWWFRRIRQGMATEPGRRGAWWIGNDPDDRYLRELGNVQLELRQGKHRAVEEHWVSVGADHFFDAECMAMVAAELCGVAELVDNGMAAEPEPGAAVHPDDEPPPGLTQADQVRKRKAPAWTSGRRDRGGGWAIRRGRR